MRKTKPNYITDKMIKKLIPITRRMSKAEKLERELLRRIIK